MRAKRIFVLSLAMLIAVSSLLSFAGCKQGNLGELPERSSDTLKGSDPASAPETSGTTGTPDVPDTEERKILIVYFTWSNNTEQMANTIHDKTGGTVYKIVPVNPYPSTPIWNGDILHGMSGTTMPVRRLKICSPQKPWRNMIRS